MTQRAKNIFGGCALVVVVIAVLLILLALIARRVPTAQDARASEQIRLEFVRAMGPNLPADKHVTVVSSPRRNATMILVSGGSLTVDEMQRLRIVAAQAGKMSHGRPVTVVFRDQ